MDAIKEGMQASAKAAEAAARIGERLFCQNTPNVMNFNSQLCTSHIQSERLLALGLKKETADMVYKPHYVNNVLTGYYQPKVLDKIVLEYMLTDDSFKDYIPAWSLHRLMELDLSSCKRGAAVAFHTESVNNAYECLINHIEWLIKEGYFNKGYLEE